MSTVKQLKAAAVELNKVLFDGNPEIDVNADEDAFMALMQEAVGLIKPDDVFSKPTQAVVTYLKTLIEAETEAPEDGIVAEEIIEEDADEYEDEDEDEDVEIEQLKEDVESAIKISELKAYAKENLIFAALVPSLGTYKVADVLRESMLNILNNPAKQIVEEDEEPVADIIKAKVFEKPTPSKTIVVPKAEKPKAEKVEKEAKEEAAPRKRTSTTKEKVDYITPFIEKAKYKKAELVELLLDKFPDASKQAVVTVLTDGKNPKYNKFAKLLVQDTAGVLSFVKK